MRRVLKAWLTRLQTVSTMLAKGSLFTVKKRLVYECLVRTEQDRPDRTIFKEKLPQRMVGRVWKLFTWVGGHGLRRGPLRDAFFCQLTPGTSLGTWSTYQRPLSRESGPLLRAEPMDVSRWRPGPMR